MKHARRRGGLVSGGALIDVHDAVRQHSGIERGGNNACQGMGHNARSRESIRSGSDGRGRLTGLIVEQGDAVRAAGLRNVDADHRPVEGRNLRVARRRTGGGSRLQNRQEGDEQWVLRVAHLDAKRARIVTDWDATRN